jgi:rubrerythrin
MMRKIFVLLCGLGIAAPFAAAVSEPTPVATLANLQAAYNGERNAHARYLTFAKKADDEGYAGVASLFRAAARAEEIHAANHAVVIKKLGAVAFAKLEKPEVKSTRENLQVAIKGETHERDQMYPAFIQQAERDQIADAVRTFKYALAAEAEHAKLYSEALKNPEAMKTAMVFYVCPVCGFTTPTLGFEHCPTCATPKEHFEQVS